MPPDDDDENRDYAQARKREEQIFSQSGGGWSEYRRLVLSEIERTNRSINGLRVDIEEIRNRDLSQLRIDIAMLQVKSSVWGGLAGLVVAVAVAIFTLLKH